VGGGDAMYMLGSAAVCWATWKIRNKICFEKIHIKDPGEIFFSAVAFMR
jgi:hypothetical protein